MENKIHPDRDQKLKYKQVIGEVAYMRPSIGAKPVEMKMCRGIIQHGALIKLEGFLCISSKPQKVPSFLVHKLNDSHGQVEDLEMIAIQIEFVKDGVPWTSFVKKSQYGVQVIQ